MPTEIEKAAKKGQADFFSATKGEMLPPAITTADLMKQTGLTRRKLEWIRVRFASVVQPLMVGTVGRGILWSAASPYIFRRLRSLIGREEC